MTRRHALVPHGAVDRTYAGTTCIVYLSPQKTTAVARNVVHAPLAFRKVEALGKRQRAIIDDETKTNAPPRQDDGDVVYLPPASRF
jgi:hypothetical protein